LIDKLNSYNIFTAVIRKGNYIYLLNVNIRNKVWTTISVLKACILFFHDYRLNESNLTFLRYTNIVYFVHIKLC